MTLPITDLKILSAPKKHRELIQKQKSELGDEFIMVPVDLNKAHGGDWIYLCYLRAKDGVPITDLQVVTGKRPPSSPKGYEKLSQDLNANAGGDFIYLCCKKGGTQVPIVDLLVQATGGGTQSTPHGYEKIDVDLNRHAGGDFIFLYFQRSQRQDALDLSKGIRPEMAEGDQQGAQVEVARAQVAADKILIRKQVVNIDRSQVVSKSQPWHFDQEEYQGMEESHKSEVALEIGLKSGVSFEGFSSELNIRLGRTETTFKSVSRHSVTRQSYDLEKADVDREVRLCSLHEVVEVRSLPHLAPKAIADSITNYRGFFVREGRGPLKLAR
jgi:hypothetical protein